MKLINSVTLAPASYKTVVFTERFEKMLKVRDQRSMIKSRLVSVDEARFLACKLRNAVGETADDSALMRVLTHDPETTHLAEHHDGGRAGCFAYLPLRPAGLEALTLGQLDRRNPDIDLLCRAHRAPVALDM
jgi:hypothetical protein